MRIVIALFLLLSLNGCVTPTERVVVQYEVQYILPALAIRPCDKPQVQGTWPEVVIRDIPQLKSALSLCAGQVDAYLKWRKQVEDGA